jgi:hypothetical protein
MEKAEAFLLAAALLMLNLLILAQNHNCTVVTFNKRDFKKLGCESSEPK